MYIRFPLLRVFTSMQSTTFLIKCSNSGRFFVLFIITISIIQIEKRVDVVLWIRTQGCRMVGADKTMEVGGHNTFYLKDNEFSLPNLVAVRLVHTSCQMLQLLQWTAMCPQQSTPYPDDTYS